jgi:citrate synthase
MNVSIDVPFVTAEFNEANIFLLDLLMEAHARTAKTNPNASSYACHNAAMTTGKLENGLASGIMALGGHHAPICEARIVYRNWVKVDIDAAMKAKMLIPGFGNSFFKGGIDPAWNNVDSHMSSMYPKEYGRIKQLQEWIVENNCTLFPNAALYTAAICDILGVVPGTEVALLILARLPVWTVEWAKHNDNHRIIKM